MSANTKTSPSKPAAAADKTILAERFKTKTCKNFSDKGACPYEWRCMFAHGESELRTKQQNLDDGLTTEDAIRAFQRSRIAAIRAARKKAKAAAAAAAAEGASSDASSGSAPSPVPTAQAAATPDITKFAPPLESHLASFAATAGDASDVRVSPREDAAATSGSSVPMPSVSEVSPSTFAFDPKEDSVGIGYDTSKYVSPLAAAMLAKKAICTDACHCDRCRMGQAHHAGAILLA